MKKNRNTPGAFCTPPSGRLSPSFFEGNSFFCSPKRPSSIRADKMTLATAHTQNDQRPRREKGGGVGYVMEMFLASSTGDQKSK